MKLFEITNFDDETEMSSNPDAIRYMWQKLFPIYWRLKKGHQKNLAKQKILKYKNLWAKIPSCAYNYALGINDRFPEGEPAIATSSYKNLYEPRFKCKI